MLKKVFKLLSIFLFFILPMFWLIPQGAMTGDMSYIVYTVFSMVISIICIEISSSIETRVIDNIEDLNRLENFFKICDYETEKRNEDKNNGY